MADLLFAHCRKCKYELTGIGRVGSCPECGQRYNLNTGWGTLENQDPKLETRQKLRRIKIAVLFWLSVIMVLTGTGFIFLDYEKLGWLGVLGAGLVLLVAISNYFDHRQAMEKENQELATDEKLLAGKNAFRKHRPTEVPMDDLDIMLKKK